MVLSSTALSRTCHPAPSVSDAITLSHPSILAYVAFSKAPFLVLCFSSCTHYTTPLSTLISSLSLNHHLYADDTQLFFSFYPPNFDSSITLLQNALQQISTWMTANLLTLNSSRLNSYSLDSKSNLTRYTTRHSTPLTLLAISASSLMNILPFPTKFQPSPKLVITISDSFVVSVLSLIPPQRAPLPPQLFTLNSITVILSTTTYRSLRLPASNWFRTVSPVQLLKLLNPVTSLLSYALFTGSK